MEDGHFYVIGLDVGQGVRSRIPYQGFLFEDIKEIDIRKIYNRPGVFEDDEGCKYHRYSQSRVIEDDYTNDRSYLNTNRYKSWGYLYQVNADASNQGSSNHVYGRDYVDVQAVLTALFMEVTQALFEQNTNLFSRNDEECLDYCRRLMSYISRELQEKYNVTLKCPTLSHKIFDTAVDLVDIK